VAEQRHAILQEHGKACKKYTGNIHEMTYVGKQGRMRGKGKADQKLRERRKRRDLEG